MKNINVIREITVTYTETPADMEEIKTLNIGLPRDFAANNKNIKIFIRECMKKEIFSIIEFKVTAIRPLK